MQNKWLPDKRGEFYKPGKLKFDDFPECFERDEKLANQLDREKDVVAKLAEEAGVSVDDISLIKQLKDTRYF